MASVPARRSRNLTQNVVTALSERIRHGEFHVGEKLPTESALMESFGVSRTVRTTPSRVTCHGAGTSLAPPAETGRVPRSCPPCRVRALSIRPDTL